MTLTMAFVYVSILLLLGLLAEFIALSLRNAELMEKYD